MQRKRSKKPLCAVLLLAALLCAGCAAGKAGSGAQETGLYLTVSCEEPVYEVTWRTVGGDGGVRNADRSAFAKGERVKLEPSAPKNAGDAQCTLTVVGEGKTVLAERTFADGLPEAAELTLTAELEILVAGEENSAAGGESVAIIGGADGPTSIFIAGKGSSEPDEAAKESIAALVQTIASSPKEASDPAAYIAAHPQEYQALVGYGQETLDYCFMRFEKGGETGLEGHIMAAACCEILGVELAAENGQQWYDALAGGAQ